MERNDDLRDEEVIDGVRKRAKERTVAEPTDAVEDPKKEPETVEAEKVDEDMPRS